MSAMNQNKAKPVQGSDKEQVHHLYRLSQGQYRELEKQVVRGTVREDTTPVQSGYYNGIEHVLRKLREGFVSE